MKWIKFIIVSLFCFYGYKASACVDLYTPATCYMFSVYNRNSLTGDSVKLKHIAFWKAYTQNQLSDKDLSNALYGKDKKERQLLTDYLSRHNDRDAFYYVSLLASMNRISSDNDQWNYPTKADLINRKKTWLLLLKEASRKIDRSKNLSSRYWLMAVRAAFYSGNRKMCQQLWNKYSRKFPKGYIKDLAEGYQANYWYGDGEREKVREFYARVGDLRSLRWCFRNDIGLSGIQRLYAEAPHSMAFPYLIQDYVNSMDNDRMSLEFEEPGKVDSTKLALEKEMNDFRTFASTVISEDKVEYPALWKSAAAYFAYLEGKNKKAIDELAEADAMKGNERMKDNIRAIRFLVSSTTADYHQGYDDYVLKELHWLVDKVKAEPMYADWYSYRSHYTDVMERIVFFNLTPGYLKAGRFTTAAALTGMVHEYIDVELSNQKHGQIQPGSNEWNMAQDYNNELFDLLDTADVKDVVAYAALIRNTDKGTDLEKYAASYCYNNSDYFNELIGTKYLRLEQFGEARTYLEKVPLAFMSKLNTAPYLHREVTSPYWFAWQMRGKLKGKRYVTAVLTENPKLAFCDEMLNLQHDFATATDDVKKADCSYRIAELYAQASLTGDCWAYLHYSWSAYKESVRSHSQENYCRKAQEWLEKSNELDFSDANRVKCLFALASLSDKPWSEIGYDENYKEKLIYHFDGSQAKAFNDLYPLRSSPAFVECGLKKCDNLSNYFDHFRDFTKKMIF